MRFIIFLPFKLSSFLPKLLAWRDIYFVFLIFSERMAQAKINRKHEKKMKENLIMLDDERRHADQYKEQAEKVSLLFIL